MEYFKKDINGHYGVLVLSVVVKGDTVFIGMYKVGVYLSNDKCNWTAANSGLYKNTVVGAIVMRDSTLFAGMDNGVFISTHNGKSWNKSDSGIRSKTIKSLVLRKSVGWEGTYKTNVSAKVLVGL